MIGLNLLPEKIRAGERLKFILLGGGAVYALGLFLLGWLWALGAARLGAVQAEVDEINRQLNAPELKEAVQAVERFTKDKKEKDEKASVVNALRMRQVTLIRLLDNLPDWTLNGEVWITRLDVSEVKGGHEVKMDGSATSALTFAHFFTNLDSQPLVESLKLTSPIQSKTQGTRQLVTFAVTFTLAEYK